MRNAAEVAYGTAGRAFVRRLVGEAGANSEEFREYLADWLRQEERRLAGIPLNKRITKTLALIAIAGKLAKHWDILPREIGSVGRAVELVADNASRSSPATTSSLKRVQDYIDRHREQLVKLDDIHAPLDFDDFNQVAGFKISHCDGRQEVMVPTSRFRRDFPDHLDVMRELRDGGRARTERGVQSKLSIKAPKAICENGRVYCISLSHREQLTPDSKRQ
jgi:hypothetical protein